MPVIVTCYKCGRKLRIHDHLVGRKARCPVCKSIFMTAGDGQDPPAPTEQETYVAPYGSAPPIRRPPPADSAVEEPLEGILHETNEEYQEPAYPRPIGPLRRKPHQRAGWEKVRIGVTLKLLGVVVRLLMILVILVSAIGLLVTGGLAERLRSQEGLSAEPSGIIASVVGLAIILVLMGLTAVSLDLAGNAFCLAAPEKYGAKTLAMIVLILAVLSLITDCMGVVIPFASFIGNLIGLIEFFLFLFFLRAVARCLNSRDLEDTVRTAMTLLGLTVGWFLTIPLIILVGIATGAIEPRTQERFGFIGYLLCSFGCIGFILTLLNLIWYIRSLSEGRSEIGYYLDRHY